MFYSSVACLLLTRPVNPDNTSSDYESGSQTQLPHLIKKDFPSGQLSVGVLSVEMENGNVFLYGGDLFSVVNHMNKIPRQASEWSSGSVSPDSFKPADPCKINQLWVVFPG